MTAMQPLAEQLNALARPGIAVEAVDDQLRFKVVSRQDPSVTLWSALASWITPADDAARRKVILGFDAFNDAVPLLIDQADRSNVVSVIIGQDIFNAGIVRNPHLMDVLRFDIDYLEPDPEVWETA